MPQNNGFVELQLFVSVLLTEIYFRGLWSASCLCSRDLLSAEEFSLSAARSELYFSIHYINALHFLPTILGFLTPILFSQKIPIYHG